jgi:hypothetical protein
MDNDDMVFQCDYQNTIFEHGNWCMTKEWLLRNDMDNINMTVSNDYEMTKKWLVCNDMGNVDHLLPTYLLATSYFLQPTYLQRTILQLAYYLPYTLVIIWNKHVK